MNRLGLGLIFAASVAVTGCSLGGSASGGNSTTTPPTTAAGSSGSSTANQPAASIDSCSLINVAEATTALGANPGAGVKKDGVHCDYRIGGDSPLQSAVTVAVWPMTRSDWDALRNAGNNQGALSKLAPQQDITGVGEAAYVAVSAPSTNVQGGTINFYKNGSDVDIIFSSTTTTTSTPMIDRLTTLARAAAGRV